MTPKTINLEMAGEQIDVPTTFTSSDFAETIGDVPKTVEIGRIFEFGGVVRAEARLEDGSVVEIANFSDNDFRDGAATGWVANRISNPSAVEDGITIWQRGAEGISLPN